jgi:hypothetical protein
MARRSDPWLQPMRRAHVPRARQRARGAPALHDRKWVVIGAMVFLVEIIVAVALVGVLL